MFEGQTELQAREQILAAVSEYCDAFHGQKVYTQGDRIPYASRVYDHTEMVNLVDSALDFWLTAGRFSEKFEKVFASYVELQQVDRPRHGYTG